MKVKYFDETEKEEKNSVKIFVEKKDLFRDLKKNIP